MNEMIVVKEEPIRWETRTTILSYADDDVLLINCKDDLERLFHTFNTTRKSLNVDMSWGETHNNIDEVLAMQLELEGRII